MSLTTMLLGLVPAAQAFGEDIQTSLKDGAPNLAGGRAFALKLLLVVALGKPICRRSPVIHVQFSLQTLQAVGHALEHEFRGRLATGNFTAPNRGQPAEYQPALQYDGSVAFS